MNNKGLVAPMRVGQPLKVVEAVDQLAGLKAVFASVAASDAGEGGPQACGVAGHHDRRRGSDQEGDCPGRSDSLPTVLGRAACDVHGATAVTVGR